MVASPHYAPHYRAVALAAATGLVVQFLLVSWTFPLSALLSEQPLFYIDGAYHWYQIHVARELGLQGRLTGYDPYFAAGHLGGVTLNASAKVPALLAIAFNGLLSDTQVYKLYVFTAAVVGPSLVPISAGIWRIGSRAMWIATALGICIWWASAFRWYHTAGMVSFVFACFMSLPYVALVLRSIHEPSNSLVRVVLLGSLGALGMFLHPLFPVLVALATVPYLIIDWRAIAWGRTVIILGAVSTLSLAPNLPWVFGMLRADATIAGVGQYQARVDITTIPKELIGLWRGASMGAKVHSGLLVAALVGAWGAVAACDRRFARTSLLVWALIAVFAAVGAALPGASAIQPNRFSTAAYLTLVLPAALGTGALVSWLKSKTWRVRTLAIGLSGICTVSFAWSAAEVAREVSHQPVGHYGAIPPEVRELGDKSKWLVSWLSTNTSKDGRVLFELSKGRIHDGAHMAGYYAISTEREFIGGPYPYMFTASYWDAFLFGKRINAIPHSEFKRYLEIYNVGWIVVHTAISKEYLAAMPDVTMVAENADLQIYRVERALSYFLVGSGHVEERGINRLVLSKIAGTEVVIAYHFVPGLTAEPPTIVEPVSIPGASKPFVRLRSIAAERLNLSVR